MALFCARTQAPVMDISVLTDAVADGGSPYGSDTIHTTVSARLQPDGPRFQARRRDRAGGGRVVSHRYSAQADEGADAALRRAGDPRHRDRAGRADPECRRRRLVLGQLVVRAVLLRLWRALRLLHRLTL